MQWFRRRRGHDTPPSQGHLSDEELAQAAHGILDSDYAASIRSLGEQLGGKIVADSTGGHSGYLLRFEDGDWVAVWLDPDRARMTFSTGNGEPPPEVTASLSSRVIADGSGSLDVDRPYAEEANDIAAEARRTHGKPVEGVAIGERSFSLCFPDGRELEGSVFEDASGRSMLRVFYEQW